MQKYLLDQKRLILSRKKLGITKQEAARRMYLSQPAYLRYESGERNPSIHVIQTMANILGTSVEYLTGETDDSIPTSYLIQEASNPDLFHLIEIYRNTNLDNQKRLLSYVDKILK